ncbi:hypothetical protein Anas_11092 [Armadillidium nasatum]|uniref:CARD domain-containing protein n=1 Tax=Armadillidium nasatum TaxID=96803 RepID=A0A5N5SUU4_9CRUS|nr:hypothetical protein Anas_11092 [Armadillidium nasatum]
MYSFGSNCNIIFNKMDDHMKELLFIHRNKFASLDIERLIPPLRENNILTQDDIDNLRRQANPVQRMHNLLDILPSKGSQAFQTLCLALENISPHLLTIMLNGNLTEASILSVKAR